MSKRDGAVPVRRRGCASERGRVYSARRTADHFTRRRPRRSFLPGGDTLARVVYVLALTLAVSGALSAPLALALGIAVGLVFGNPWPKHSARAAKWLLQIAVVGLGFSLSLAELWRAGRVAVVLTLLAISLTIAIGLWLGRRFGVTENTARLITVGTAICGGSAIAAVAPILRADEDEIGAALATVFTLNAVALFLFPYLGAALDLSEPEFGFWAALSIHDTSSVVAAGTVYGSTALAVATLVKLTRAAWLAPLALAVAARFRSAGRVSFPWFILGFLAAAVVASTLPQHSAIWAGIVSAARHALVVTLFLIGTGMTRAVLARVGARPLLFGTALWLLVAVGSLLLVTSGLPLH